MNIGLGISAFVHAVLILWALVTIQRVKPLAVAQPPAIAVSMVSPSELAAIAKGERDAKNLSSGGADGTAKKDPPKKVATPPPPPKEAAPLPPPPPPSEPVKTSAAAEPPPPPPEPKKVQPPPPPPPGPSAEDKKKLEEAILADQAKAVAEAEARSKAEAEARAKAEADARAKAEAERKRKAELARQKRLAEQKRREAEAKRKADAAARAKAEADAKAKQFDPNDIMKRIEQAEDGGPKQALKDNRIPKPAQAAGAKGAGPKGPQAGLPTGTAPLTKGEQNQLVALIRDQLKSCWNINSGHPDAARMQPVFDFELNRDGSLRGEPVLTNPENSPAFQDAANAARRAFRCASPFKGLPPDKYEHWEFATFRFDPSQMFR